PIRLITPQPNICFHEVEVSRYPLFEYPPYDLALATRMAEVAENYDLHLLHVHRADGVRNCVMHVKKIEVVILRDLRHTRSQGQVVRRIFKQRIARDFYFMEADIRLRSD